MPQPYQYVLSLMELVDNWNWNNAKSSKFCVHGSLDHSVQTGDSLNFKAFTAFAIRKFRSKFKLVRTVKFDSTLLDSMPPRKKTAPMSPPPTIPNKANKATAKAKAKAEPPKPKHKASEEPTAVEPLYTLEVRDTDGNIVPPENHGTFAKKRKTGKQDKLQQLSPNTVGKYQQQWKNFGVVGSTSTTTDSKAMQPTEVAPPSEAAASSSATSAAAKLETATTMAATATPTEQVDPKTETETTESTKQAAASSAATKPSPTEEAAATPLASETEIAATVTVPTEAVPESAEVDESADAHKNETWIWFDLIVFSSPFL